MSITAETNVDTTTTTLVETTALELEAMLSIQDVADRLKVPRRAIYKLLWAHQLEGCRIGPRTWRIKPSAVARYLSQTSVTPD